MENKQIVKWNIEQSKKEIQKNLLKDNLIIFFTRILEDSKVYRNPNFYGRVKLPTTASCGASKNR